jgi:hypothetical protein
MARSLAVAVTFRTAVTIRGLKHLGAFAALPTDGNVMEAANNETRHFI